MPLRVYTDYMITAKTDARAWMLAMKIVAKDKLPLAVANTLNTVSRAVHTASERNLRTEFILRNQYTLRSMRHSPAKPKHNIGSMYAWTGTISPYLGIQEEGGTVNPKTGDRVPVPVGAARGGNWRSQILRRYYMSRIGKIGGKGSDFFATDSAIWQRKGRRKIMIRSLRLRSYRLRPRRWHSEAVDKFGKPSLIEAVAVREIRKLLTLER